MPPRKTLADFKQQLEKVHGDKYTFEDKHYRSMGKLVEFTCNAHGKFLKTPFNLLRTSGCSQCSNKTNSKKPEITHAELVDKLIYNSDNGKFIWKHNQKLAGHIGERGCISIRINNRKYKAHRLAIFYITGIMPLKSVLHLNQIKMDNRLDNLLVDEGGTYAFKLVEGVYFGDSKWYAKLVIKGELHLSKGFETKGEALQARKDLEVKFLGEVSLFTG